MGVRARAREGPPEGPPEQNGDERTSVFREALVSPEPEEPEGPRPWPASHWDLEFTEAVLLSELFESFFGKPAKFSYQRRSEHGAALRRILARFDRFSWADPRYSGDPRGPLESRPGFRRACEVIRRRGRMAQLGNPKANRPNSLAYFLPQLDQESKALRRRARALEAEG